MVTPTLFGSANTVFPVETIGLATSLGVAILSTSSPAEAIPSCSINRTSSPCSPSTFTPRAPNPPSRSTSSNGQGHRVRSVIEAADGYVVLEAYQRRAEITGTKGRWQDDRIAERQAE